METQPQLAERKRSKAPAGYIKRPVTRTKSIPFRVVLANPTSTEGPAPPLPRPAALGPTAGGRPTASAWPRLHELAVANVGPAALLTPGPRARGGGHARLAGGRWQSRPTTLSQGPCHGKAAAPEEGAGGRAVAAARASRRAAATAEENCCHGAPPSAAATPRRVHWHPPTPSSWAEAASGRFTLFAKPYCLQHAQCGGVLTTLCRAR